jgi:hypothetical protein
MSLNTQIVGDPQGCRAYGGWLRALGEGALDTADLLNQVSANSEYCWGGQVGELFRGRMDEGKRDASVLYDEISRVGDAVNLFADDLSTAMASMKEARMVAVQGGLPVTPTTIEPPPMPEHLTDTVVPDRLSDIVAESEENVRYEGSLGAYADAERIVTRARAEEQEAHDAFARRTGDLKRQLDAIKRVSRFLPLLDAVAAGPSSTYSQASTWTRLAQRHQDIADEARRIWDSPAHTQLSRDKMLAEFLLNQGRAASAGRRAALVDPGRVLGGLQRSTLGRGVLEGLASNAERAAARNGAQFAPSAAATVLRSVPVAGVLGAGAGAAMDIAAGESPTQAIVSNGAAATAGAATTTLLLSSAVAGPAGIGAVAAGVGMAWLADTAVDHLMAE